MAHPQARMPALLDVTRRSAEASDQKLAQPFLRADQVVRRIHRAEHIVVRHLRVERAHESRKAILADGRIDLFFVHSSLVRASRAASCSASFLARPVAVPSTSPLTITSTLKILR